MLWLTTLIACDWFWGSPPPEETRGEPAEEPVADLRPAVDPKAGLGAVEKGASMMAAPPIEPVVSRSGVGFITHQTSRGDLEKKLGADAVTDHRFDQGEGTFLPGLRVLGDTPYELLLQSDGKTVERIQVVGNAYRLDNGIHVGSSFAELERAHGDFHMFGYGWDYGGTLVDEGFEPPGFQIAVRTRPDDPGKRDWSAKAREILSGGDRRFASSHEGMDEIRPRVHEVVLVWRDEAGKRRK